MLIFNLTNLHLWGRVIAKFPESRSIVYVDDGYMKTTLILTLQVLTDLKCVLKEDAGLELNVFKTSVLPKGITQQSAFDEVHNINTRPTLTHLNRDVLLVSFCQGGSVGIGVPIGTDAFVQKIVANMCTTIIDDVEKLDTIQDGFIHYQLLRFYQVTRRQYINSHILLGNRCFFQLQHVDCKIAESLLKKASKLHTDDWDTDSKS